MCLIYLLVAFDPILGVSCANKRVVINIKLSYVTSPHAALRRNSKDWFNKGFKVSIGYLEKYTLLYEMLEDTEEIIRIHKSKKDKQ